jgi:DNA polymerase-1
MIAVQKWLDEAKLRALLIMQVHDELVLEVPDVEVASVKDRLVELMQSVHRLDVPLIVQVGVGENWDEAH